MKKMLSHSNGFTILISIKHLTLYWFVLCIAFIAVVFTVAADAAVTTAANADAAVAVDTETSIGDLNVNSQQHHNTNDAVDNDASDNVEHRANLGFDATDFEYKNGITTSNSPATSPQERQNQTINDAKLNDSSSTSPLSSTRSSPTSTKINLSKLSATTETPSSSFDSVPNSESVATNRSRNESIHRIDDVENEIPQADDSSVFDLLSRPSTGIPQRNKAVYFIVAVSGGAKIWSRTLARTLLELGMPFDTAPESPLRPLYIDLPTNGR